MHDLMHELAQKISSNEYASINGLQAKTMQPSIRHLSIITTAFDNIDHGHFSSKSFEKVLPNIRHLQKLRTLMFFGGSSAKLIRTRFFETLCKKTESLRLLRIYYMKGDDINYVHIFIKPYHLRYLEFIPINCENISFPQALTRLYHIQLLDVGIWSKPTLPTGMNNLINLRHLIAGYGVHSTITSIGSMTSLQELQEFRVENACGYEIKQLQSMSKLVLLAISQLENVKTKEEASQAKLVDKDHLEKLQLSWKHNGVGAELTTERTKDVHVLEGLRPNQKLKHLHVTGYNGAIFPAWLDGNVSMKYLRALCLNDCRGLTSSEITMYTPADTKFVHKFERASM